LCAYLDDLQDGNFLPGRIKVPKETEEQPVDDVIRVVLGNDLVIAQGLGKNPRVLPEWLQEPLKVLLNEKPRKVSKMNEPQRAAIKQPQSQRVMAPSPKWY